jgi:hypothetical protein
MARLYLLLFVMQIALAVIALIGCLSAEAGDIRGLPRIGWILVILFFPLIGSIAWFIAGRPRTKPGPGSWRAGAGFPERERPRPVAPDDDPEFLRTLDEGRSRTDDELFQKWEEDLRRREDELRKQKDDDRPEERNP